ncbi:MAG: prepilin-type N-terminal cleavage/methylation domain-containing protein [Planctomycetota bacterium]
MDVIEVGKFQVQECKFPVNLKPRLPLQNPTGFTLIEIIIVLVIIGIIAGVTIPRFAGSFETIKFRKAMSDIVSFLRESRIASMSTGKTKTVGIDLRKGFLWNDDKRIHVLPPQMETFTDKADAGNEQTKLFTFYPNGTAIQEKLGFISNKMTAVLHVDPLGGVVYYKVDDDMAVGVLYPRVKEPLSSEEIKKEIDKLTVSDKLTE